MKPKTSIAVGALFAAAWLFLAGGHAYDYLTGGDTSTASLLIGMATAGCGIIWSGLHIRDGIRKLRKAEDE